jgi:hypothetical protein
MSLSRFENRLVRSGLREAPPAARKQANRAAVMRAAGFAAATGATAGSGSATASTAPAPVVSTGAAGAAKASLATKIVLALAIGAGATTAVLATTHLLRATPTATPTPTPTPIATATATATATVTPTPTAEEPAKTDEAPPAPRVVTAKKTVTDAPDPLAVEAKLLDDARTCLAHNNTTCASARLAEHDARFPSGALTDEALVLAMDIARARGDSAGARSAAERLLARHPTGAYATRARAVLEGTR